MKTRCKSNHSKNESWNGRRIIVCNEWQEFIPFFNWAIKNGYRKGLVLDRINNDGNYCPENCRFTTWNISNKNKRKSQRMPRDLDNDFDFRRTIILECGITETTFYNWKSGRIIPGKLQREKINEITGVSVEIFFKPSIIKN